MTLAFKRPHWELLASLILSQPSVEPGLSAGGRSWGSRGGGEIKLPLDLGFSDGFATGAVL